MNEELPDNLSEDIMIQKSHRGKAPVGLPKTVRIVIEENDSVPPNGLYMGLNGRGYLIKPGVPVDVPIGLVEILDNAIYTAPQVDPVTRQVVGHTDRLRYPYREVRKTKAA
jgi:hypothetical protein